MKAKTGRGVLRSALLVVGELSGLCLEVDTPILEGLPWMRLLCHLGLLVAALRTFRGSGARRWWLARPGAASFSPESMRSTRPSDCGHSVIASSALPTPLSSGSVGCARA